MFWMFEGTSGSGLFEYVLEQRPPTDALKCPINNCLVFCHALIIAASTSLPGECLSNFDSLEEMTKDIASKYFSTDFCIGIITEDPEAAITNVISQQFPTVIIRPLLSENGIPVTTSNEEFGSLRPEIIAFDNQLVQMMNLGCRTFVIQVYDACNMVKYIYRNSRRTTKRSTMRFLYLQLSAPAKTDFDIKHFFAMKEMDVTPDVVYAHRVVVDSSQTSCEEVRGNSWEYFNCLVNSTNDISENRSKNSIHTLGTNNINITYMFLLLTHRFTGNDYHEVQILDIWVPNYPNGFQEGKDIYPDKIQNLHGKVLNVSTVIYPPYTTVDASAIPPVYDGIELRFMKEFATLLNFTLRIVIDDEGSWGEVWPNGTGIGMYGDIAMDVSIIGFGATYAWLPNYPFIDYSFPYFRSSVRCLTPKPKKLPGWITPILPFSSMMWIAVGISLAVAVILLQLFTHISLYISGSNTENSKYSALSYTVFWSFGMLLLQTPPENSNVLMIHYIPLRHLISWLLMFFLLVSSIYSGGLASVLTVPSFEHPIDTVEDLAETQITWAATHEAWIYSIQDTTEPNLIIITHTFKVYTEDELLEKTTTGDTAFAVERLLGGHYALPTYITLDTMPHLRATREDVYSGFPVFNVRKGSPFLEKLNALILRLQAAGMLSNYEGQVVREFLSQRLQLMVEQSYVIDGSGPVVLTFEHIQGAAFILVFGLLGAFFLFVMENLRYYLTSRRKQVMCLSWCYHLTVHCYVAFVVAAHHIIWKNHV